MTYRLFGIYSGRNEIDCPNKFGAVYEDTNGVTNIPVSTNDPLFLDLVSYGVNPESNVSVYVRAYDDGRITYLGGNGRHRRMPEAAASRFRSWLRQRDSLKVGAA